MSWLAIIGLFLPGLSGLAIIILTLSQLAIITLP